VRLPVSFVNYFGIHVTFEMFVKKLVMFVRYVGSVMYAMVLRCMQCDVCDICEVYVVWIINIFCLFGWNIKKQIEKRVSGHFV
jgi:hypothetical protein